MIAVSVIVLLLLSIPVSRQARGGQSGSGERNSNSNKSTSKKANAPPKKSPPATSTPRRTAPSASTTGSRRAPVTNRYGVEMVWIAPGSFEMGSNSGEADEKPVHRVTISKGFYMGKYEVTQKQWQAVMGANPSNFTGENLPVEKVSWYDAQDFINKLNEMNDGYKYRLPTEAEWEYAARAGTTGDYAGDLDEMAWYSDNSGKKTHPVGQKQANGWGLYDMHGNVFEWCEDYWHDRYQGAPTDSSAWLSGGESRYRVLRGGSWDTDASYCRSARRSGFSIPENHLIIAGFRLVAVART
ncbi:MAG: formylglycine-generating enzyme family protein [Pyrinomonadaceae bacterium]|nr:formylglycine-generating enzyme family protein [Pyrinomonadaceae bacterium]